MAKVIKTFKNGEDLMMNEYFKEHELEIAFTPGAINIFSDKTIILYENNKEKLDRLTMLGNLLNTHTAAINTATLNIDHYQNELDKINSEVVNLENDAEVTDLNEKKAELTKLLANNTLVSKDEEEAIQAIKFLMAEVLSK